MPDTAIDPTAVRDVARRLRIGAETLHPAGSVLAGIAALSDATVAGAAVREFTAVWSRAAQVLGDSAVLLASATADAAGIWCTVDHAVAGGSRS